jgi:hypothetical protein
MEQLTTYRAKGKDIGLIFLFKYDLNGNLKLFEISEGELNALQMKWLFAGANFPANESIIKTIWIKDKVFRDKFEIDVSPAKLDFESLWILYDNKVKRHESEKQFLKLKEADVIKIFISVPKYKDYLLRKRIAQAHLSTYINQRYFEDDWSKA